MRAAGHGHAVGDHARRNRQRGRDFHQTVAADPRVRVEHAQRDRILDRREHARMHAHQKQHHAQQPDAVQPEAQRRQQRRRDTWNPTRIGVA
ncbi:MAG: hypothetical protein ACYCOY_02225 [Metallibacterium sp.]